MRGIFGDAAPEEEVKKTAKKDDTRCQGLGILGFPSNLIEAKAVEKEFNGLVHPMDLPKPIAQTKIQESERFA